MFTTGSTQNPRPEVARRQLKTARQQTAPLTGQSVHLARSRG